MLALLWYQQKSEVTMAVEEAIERETEPEKNRRKRIRYRRLALFFTFVVSVSFIVAGLPERVTFNHSVSRSNIHGPNGLGDATGKLDTVRVG
ncbi:hypothetical protein [Gimesia maris]|uniref:hypothetical protein n=1 Tax=Gimesia maris TaxID=122 RepID=UPI000E9376E0|nr:hypothetical protein [Gimesia maris]HAW27981.1 hypothetical protein [Planctomycetaceae bacterium]